ncbi:N-acetylneuraminate synthase [Clostridium carboxidivorans P7]|uniref:N-acetylneuraminate synthase n=1 Tax=Clostridium carboxidivorans P7 TaxID=536227 RepID=C6PPI0_9CLOT|nr:N-acetylneuraminate synthase family protein [Clostridium carboxidivorans]AKN33925.1 N-acetylneuraminate synthase [Clostridium carboxidivorans P7]EET88874.1 N-acetylneuraminate synthase [Clostridium carboxidivorans P7]EFG88204.1 NeuB family protein [Clostridium carboxidivorans P7]
MNKIRIGNRFIGEGEKPYFIADIASNHDGDIKRAFKLIELAKESGADAAKFQNFKAEKIVSRNEFESIGKQLSHQSSWKKSVYEVYKDASVPKDWTGKLKEKCDEVGIEYMTSPYDFESVDLVNPYVNAFKIGSGDITWTEVLAYIASKSKPVILATGASSMKDVERAMKVIQSINKNIVIMQCNTNYTASSENYKYVNLNVLKKYKEMFPNAVLGLSDHTHGYVTVLGSIALGACVIEKHFTDDNNRTGPDHKFSMNPEVWRDMVDRAMELWYSLGDGIKKIEENEKETVMVQRRSLYFTADMKLGRVLKKEDFFPVRPIKEDGIPPYEIEKIVGKTLVKDVKKDNYIKWEDIK